jgi:Flp pilus assembly protein protease CpaA
MAILLPISIIVLNVGMPISNIKQLRFSNRVTTLISIIGICLAVMGMSFGNQFWHFLVLYGIVFGIFIGYGYMAPIKNCYEHIPSLKGTDLSK